MPRRRGLAGPPSQFAVEGSWPDGRLAGDAPVVAYYAAEISRRLRSALDGRVQAQVAREADLARSTLNDIVAGRQWPDVVTVAKLEHVLGVRLWPEWPPGAGPPHSRR